MKRWKVCGLFQGTMSNCLKKLRKTTQNLIQDLNRAHPKHKPGAIPLELTCSVGKMWSWPVPRGYPGICIEQENHEKSLAGYPVICQTTELHVY